MSSGVAVGIVTYGSRAGLLRETLRRVVAGGADLVVVVFNGASRRTVELVTREYPEVRRIELRENGGSASGFGTALEALRTSGKHVLLLDDDNWIQPGGIARLSQEWAVTGAERQSSCFALACYHPANEAQSQVANGAAVRDAYPILRRGSIEGFDVLNRMSRLFGLRGRATVGQHDRAGASGNARSLGEVGDALVPVAPYGGLCISRDWAQQIGLPNAAMVLYNDDYEFTRRAVRAGLDIRLCTQVAILEGDRKGSTSVSRSYVHSMVSTSPDGLWRVLYRVRNAAYLYGKEAADQGALGRFYVNLGSRIFMVLAWGVVVGRFGAARKIARAYANGARGRLGRSYYLPGAEDES